MHHQTGREGWFGPYLGWMDIRKSLNFGNRKAYDLVKIYKNLNMLRFMVCGVLEIPINIGNLPIRHLINQYRW